MPQIKINGVAVEIPTGSTLKITNNNVYVNEEFVKAIPDIRFLPVLIKSPTHKKRYRPRIQYPIAPWLFGWEDRPLTIG